MIIIPVRLMPVTEEVGAEEFRALSFSNQECYTI